MHAPRLALAPLVVALVLACAAPAGAQSGGALADVACTDGAAGLFPCGEVDLAAFVPYADLGADVRVAGYRVLNDVWGWVDEATGREYALVGRVDGTAFVDVTDPVAPVYLGHLPTAADTPASTWRDVKVYGTHAFVVADGIAHGMQVFDLRRLRDAEGAPQTFTADAHYDGFGNAHNLFVHEATGFAYAVGTGTCGGGLHMMDVRTPEAPAFVGCFAHPGTGIRGTGYTHDVQCVVYHGPDAAHAGREVCFGANENVLSIVDVTDKQAPFALAAGPYPNAAYTHQGWLSEDHRYFFLGDEADEGRGLAARTRTLVWDVTDLDDPVLVTQHLGTTGATDHNQYVLGTHLYQANYAAGLRILDVSVPEAPVEVAFFDTYPSSDHPGYVGAWSVYPFLPSGTVLVSSQGEGLFVLRPRVGVPAVFGAVAAARDGAAATVTWTTAREEGGVRFVLEHRAPGAAWTAVDSVAAAGTPGAYRLEAPTVGVGRHAFRVRAEGPSGRVYSRTAEVVVPLDGAYRLVGPFPVPFAERATFTLTTGAAGPVRVALYDALGREVGVLYEGPLAASEARTFTLHGAGLAAGVYVLRVAGPGFATTRVVPHVR